MIGVQNKPDISERTVHKRIKNFILGRKSRQIWV